MKKRSTWCLCLFWFFGLLMTICFAVVMTLDRSFFWWILMGIFFVAACVAIHFQDKFENEEKGIFIFNKRNGKDIFRKIDKFTNNFQYIHIEADIANEVGGRKEHFKSDFESKDLIFALNKTLELVVTNGFLIEASKGDVLDFSQNDTIVFSKTDIGKAVFTGINTK